LSKARDILCGNTLHVDVFADYSDEVKAGCWLLCGL